jgi:hypothetical protein
MPTAGFNQIQMEEQQKKRRQHQNKPTATQLLRHGDRKDNLELTDSWQRLDSATLDALPEKPEVLTKSWQ